MPVPASDVEYFSCYLLELTSNGYFSRGGLPTFHTTPTPEGQGSLLCLTLTFNLSDMQGGPTSSYATAGIALRVSYTHKPPHRGKEGAVKERPQTILVVPNLILSHYLHLGLHACYS
jgi:hypothetical protein